MGASSSVVGKNVFVSFEQTCDENLKQQFINHIESLSYHVINKEFINQANLSFIETDDIKSQILIANYVLIFISKNTINSHTQIFVDHVSTQNNKNIIYMIMEESFLPVRNPAIKKFIGNNVSYPCYNQNTIEYSLNKLSNKFV